MPYSLNEIEAMCKRATRGAGLPWGIAEEAGKASRWLASHNLPGPEMLSKLLALHQGTVYQDFTPVFEGTEFRPTSDTLCPLMAGAALIDRISEFPDGQHIEFKSIAYPILLAPYAAFCARKIGLQFELSWAGVRVIISPEGHLKIEGNTALITSPHSTSVVGRSSSTNTDFLPQKISSRDVDTEGWNSLAGFSSRMYAPATEASRKLGAG